MAVNAAVAWRRAIKKKRGRSLASHKAGIRAALFLGLLAIVCIYTWVMGESGVAGYHRRLDDDGSSGVDECEDVIGGGIDDSAPVLAFIIWVVVMIWVFLGISVVCDEHFESSLEVICEQLDLSTAVGGATFMAAGSSAPELATSLVAVFTTRDATGLGTILGSAVFNLVAIICLSGWFGAGPYHKLTKGKDPKGLKSFKPDHPQSVFKDKLAQINDARTKGGKAPITTDGLFLDKRPLARDAVFYVIALGMCVLFALTSVGDGWCADEANPDGIRATGDPELDHIQCQFNNKPGFVWWEGLVLSLCYGIYIHSMIIDEQLMAWMEKTAPHPEHIKAYLDGIASDDDDDDGEDDDEEAQTVKTDADPSETQGLTVVAEGDPTDMPAPDAPTGVPIVEVDGEVEVPDQHLENVKRFSDFHTLKEQVKELTIRLDELENKENDEYKEAEEEEEDKNLIVGLLSKPWEVVFAITIPACERDDYQIWEEKRVKFKDIPEKYQNEINKEREDEGEDPAEPDDEYLKGKHHREKVDLWYSQSKRYAFAFTMCIVWIGITSWAMVTLAAKMGCHLGVGAFSMGLVVLAAGTSIPDALSSIVVAKEGDGDMACANAVGSNVFNIFLGIGLPMMLSEFTWGEPFIVNDGLPVTISTVMLILITIIMYVGIGYNNWVLTPKLSMVLLTMFPLYLGACIMFDAEIIPLYKGLCSDVRGAMMGCKGVNDVVY